MFSSTDQIRRSYCKKSFLFSSAAIAANLFKCLTTDTNTDPQLKLILSEVIVLLMIMGLYYMWKALPKQIYDAKKVEDTPHLLQERLDKVREKTNEDIKIPDGMKDCIDMDIMDNPMILSCGHSFDKRNIPAITKCPLDRESIKSKTPNYNLRQSITEFVESLEAKAGISSKGLFSNKTNSQQDNGTEALRRPIIISHP